LEIFGPALVAIALVAVITKNKLQLLCKSNTEKESAIGPLWQSQAMQLPQQFDLGAVCGLACEVFGRIIGSYRGCQLLSRLSALIAVVGASRGCLLGELDAAGRADAL
jgi:hypothetical protein